MPDSKLQNAMLNELRISKKPCSVIFVNGFQMRGTVESFDAYCIILTDTNGKQNMIYKHAVSTVKPDVHIELPTVNPQGATTAHGSTKG